ncbi:MAG: metal ABC transporter permease [Clostridiales bacterium]|nr:metal ABC transporter permease [Clostridiales bacterium]
MWQTLVHYLSFPFVQHALVVGVLVALSASLLGTVLVLRRLSHIGDGLSHVAFGAMAIATVMQLSGDMLLVLPLTMLFSILLLQGNRRARGDASLAMLSVSALAVGYILFNLFPPRGGNVSGDVCTTLFGSTAILTLSRQEVWLSIGLSAVVVGLFAVFYRHIFAFTFDADFCAASGFKLRLYNLALAVVTATVIVLAMNLVGSLLITALLVFPVVSAMRVYHSFRAVTLCAAVFSVTAALLGILLSILAGTPVGATIVAADMLGFILFCALGVLKERGTKA